MTNLTNSPPPSLTWPFLERDSRGRVRIAGTHLRISMLIEAKQAHGWSPEEIHFQYPVLSLAQVYSALSYYYAHQQEIEQEIANEHQEIKRLKTELQAIGAVEEGEALRQALEAKAQ